MNSSGRSTLQDLFSTLREASEARHRSDQIAFTSPYTGSLVRQSIEHNGRQFASSGTPTPAGPESGPGYPEDLNKLARQSELAFNYSQRIRPDGDPKPYLAFVTTLKKNFQRQKKMKDGEKPTETSRDGQRRGLEKEEKEQNQSETSSGEPSEDRAKLLKDYSEEAQSVLHFAFQMSGEITEQYNLLNYASASLELDAQSLKRKIEKAARSLEALRNSDNPEDQAKIEQRQLKIEAFKRDAETTEEMIGRLHLAMDEMKEKAGQQIEDGFNLLPKSFALLAELPDGENVSGEELAQVYRDEILQITDSATFFENFLTKHREIGFKKYIRLSLQLLGSDIVSANPSRNPNQLKSIRDGIFMAQIIYQTFDRIGRMDRQFDRMQAIREKNAGTYEPNRLTIQYEPRGLRLLTDRSTGDPTGGEEFLAQSQLDLFEELTEFINGHNIDEIVFEFSNNLSAPEKQKMEGVLRSIRLKYGLRTQRRARQD